MVETRFGIQRGGGGGGEDRDGKARDPSPLEIGAERGGWEDSVNCKYKILARGEGMSCGGGEGPSHSTSASFLRQVVLLSRALNGQLNSYLAGRRERTRGRRVCRLGPQERES